MKSVEPKNDVLSLSSGRLVWRKWAFLFVVIGVNSITIYLLQRFVDFMGTVKFFLGGESSRLFPAGAALLLACGYLALSWLLLLHSKKIFLKV